MIGRLALVATIVLVAVWLVFLRPTALGGPTTYLLVSGQSMEPTIHAGSLVILERGSTYRTGEVVAYRIPDGEPASGLNVIHRIVGGSGVAGFVMRGDNTSASDLWRPRTDDIVGRPVMVIPGAMPALLFIRSPIVIASLAAALSVYLVLGLWASPDVDPKHRSRREVTSHAVDAATGWRRGRAQEDRRVRRGVRVEPHRRPSKS